MTEAGRSVGRSGNAALGQPVSVLMAVYVGERPEFFTLALASLERQSVTASQVVLVCDGPLTVELDGIIATFGSRLPLSVVKLPARRGLAEALNEGLAHCQHEWVARFDSDDVCEPNRLESQLLHIAEHPDVDVLGSRILEFEREPDRPYANRAVPLTHSAIVSTAKSRNPLNHMTVMFKRRCVLAAGGYPNAPLNEDYALWVNLIQAGCRFGNLEAALVRARAGTAMAQRRGGWAYLATEIHLQKSFLASGFIRWPTFARNIAVRAIVRLLPSAFRRWLYLRLLRQSVTHPVTSSDRSSARNA